MPRIGSPSTPPVPPRQELGTDVTAPVALVDVKSTSVAADTFGPTAVRSPVAAVSDGPSTSAAAGLRAMADAVQTGPIRTIEAANAKAEQTLALYLKDVGVDDPKAARVSIRFPRSLWPAEAFANQQQLDVGIASAAGFLSQLAADRAGPVGVEVLLTPAGVLKHNAGVEKDSLYVPLTKGLDEVALRQAWDEGTFIQPSNRWNPLDHLATAKRRQLWSTVGNPVSLVRTRMRALFETARTELTRGVDDTLAQKDRLPLDELRTRVRGLVETFVDRDTKDGAASWRDNTLSRIGGMEKSDLVTLLSAWKESANTATVDQATAFALAGGGNRVRDNSWTFGLVNVDTNDMVTVAPDSALMRHGQPALNDYENNSVRVGLVNVRSNDMVAVVPNLARMIFGGTTLERALATMPKP